MRPSTLSEISDKWVRFGKTTVIVLMDEKDINKHLFRSFEQVSDSSLKDIIIRIFSVFLATTTWYWFSDFRVDYELVTNKTIIIILTIIWFIWIPVVFRILGKKFEDNLLDKDGNILVSQNRLIMYILWTLLITCVTLWVLIAWKI